MAAGASPLRRGLLFRRGRRLRCRAWRPEILKELRPRIEHHHIAMILERGAIGFERAIKPVKLGILAKRLGVDFRSLGIALALDFLGVAVGFGKNDRALAVGV